MVVFLLEAPNWVIKLKQNAIEVQIWKIYIEIAIYENTF